ncbi:hypothetical protein [Armatimonas sp.]|uniref:hypothetical protein n=1 Tax=Armatimonas sp. TaxID=1872638 RepID=UPI003751602A
MMPIFWIFSKPQRISPGTCLTSVPLLALTYHEEKRVAWRAMLALGQLTAPRIRARLLHEARRGGV